MTDKSFPLDSPRLQDALRELDTADSLERWDSVVSNLFLQLVFVAYPKAERSWKDDDFERLFKLLGRIRKGYTAGRKTGRPRADFQAKNDATALGLLHPMTAADAARMLLMADKMSPTSAVASIFPNRKAKRPQTFSAAMKRVERAVARGGLTVIPGVPFRRNGK